VRSVTRASRSSTSRSTRIARRQRPDRSSGDTCGVQIPPRTHYLSRDGLSLAYQLFGEGPPLVMAPSVPSHLDLMWPIRPIRRCFAGLVRSLA
jgi:hypothetical protein